MIEYDGQARKNDLAKIHIAKKDLGLDDDTYRTIVREIGKSQTGSAADLTPGGRARVLQHFKSKGWKVRGSRKQKRVTPGGEILATDAQVARIKLMWLKMADAGAVHERSESALRAWVKATTRRHHGQGTGYSAPEFLPDWAAQKLIEHLKAWAKRCKVSLNDD